jgi:hypothetical protein
MLAGHSGTRGRKPLFILRDSSSSTFFDEIALYLVEASDWSCVYLARCSSITSFFSKSKIVSRPHTKAASSTPNYRQTDRQRNKQTDVKYTDLLMSIRPYREHVRGAQLRKGRQTDIGVIRLGVVAQTAAFLDRAVIGEHLRRHEQRRAHLRADSRVRVTKDI